MLLGRIKRFAALAALVAGLASLGSATHAQTITATEVAYGNTSYISELGSEPGPVYVDPLLVGQTITPVIKIGATGGAEVNGAVPDKYADPDGLSANQEYLVANPGTSATDNVTLSYKTAQSSLTILWGSIDTYNTLTLSNGADTVVVTGSQIGALLGLSFTGGGNSVAADPTGQTALVTISNLGLGSGFNTAVFSSSSAAFEFTFVAPEPASLAMSGTALLAVAGVVLRRRKAKA